MIGFTNNERLNEVLYVLATSVSMKADTIKMMRTEGTTEKTIDNFMSKIKKEKMIHEKKASVSKDGIPIEAVIRLGKKGKAVIEEKAPELYEFYKQSTGETGNNPGNTHKSIRGQIKKADVHYMFLRAGVEIGVKEQQPGVIAKTGNNKFRKEQRVFFLNREIVLVKEQRISRIVANGARSSGIIISPGFTGFVYRVRNIKEKISSRVEKQDNNLAVYFVNKICEKKINKIFLQQSLVFGNDYPMLLELSDTHSTNKLHAMRYFGDAFENRKVTETDFYYIPMGSRYADLLKILTIYGEKGVVEALFSEEERAAAKQVYKIPYPCDAVLTSKKGNTIYCYEFLTGNITKLAAIKRAYAQTNKLKNVGFVCADFQVPFLKAYFSDEYEIVTEEGERERKIVVGESAETIHSFRKLSTAQIKEIFCLESDNKKSSPK